MRSTAFMGLFRAAGGIMHNARNFAPKRLSLG